MRGHRASLSMPSHHFIHNSYVDLQAFVLSSATSARRYLEETITDDPVGDLADLPLGTVILSGVVVMAFAVVFGASISWYRHQDWSEDDEEDYLDAKLRRRRADTDTSITGSLPAKSALSSKRDRAMSSVSTRSVSFRPPNESDLEANCYLDGFGSVCYLQPVDDSLQSLEHQGTTVSDSGASASSNMVPEKSSNYNVYGADPPCVSDDLPIQLGQAVTRAEVKQIVLQSHGRNQEGRSLAD